MNLTIILVSCAVLAAFGLALGAFIFGVLVGAVIQKMLAEREAGEAVPPVLVEHLEQTAKQHAVQ